MTPDPPPGVIDPPPSTPTRPRLRWWRVVFSLRVLMAVVLVVGGLAGWQARRASIQRRAVTQLREAGAWIEYDWQIPSPGLTPAVAPSGPTWLRRVVGDELFQDVQMVSLDVTSGLKPGEPSEATMAAIAGLDHLETLQLIHAPATDAQLARLRGLPRLKSAILLDTEITAEAVATIRSWPRLEALAVRFNHAEPAGPILARFAGMSRLKRLNLSPLRPIASADLATLATLPALESWALRPSPVEGSCLGSLAGLTRLTGIHMPNTRPTDADLQGLAGLAGLERVALDGSLLTDNGFATVARWTRLQELFLLGTGAPDEGPGPTGALTDRGLAALANHPNLNNLTLAGHFTDDGLTALNRVPKLDTLILDGLNDGVTGAGLRALLAGRQFRQLGLQGSGVRDDWAPLLAGQTRLEYLTLTGPNLSDAAFGPLAGVPTLGRLFLTDVPITDAGLMTLARGGALLRVLYLRRTAVTQAGVAAFRAARPGCQVDYQPAPVPSNAGDDRRR